MEEYGDGSSSKEEDNGTINLGDGFYIYKELCNRLYVHQKEGINWFWTLYRRKKSGILADDMGLGKTIQVIAFLSGMFDMEQIKSVLIVVPLSVTTNWMMEFTKWAPGILLTLYYGTNKKQKEMALMKVQKRGGVCLTTYRTVVTSWEQLSQQDGKEFLWDYVILDEGHKIKNPTKASKGVRAIGAKNRIVITGTPLQNNLSELWALFDFLHQGSLLGTAHTFKKQYENTITRGGERDATAGEKKLGMEMAERLKVIISPYFLRRTKEEVAAGGKTEPTDSDDNVADGLTELSLEMPSLTRKNDLIVWLSLTDTQLKIYQGFLSLESVKELLMTNKNPLVALTILKKICVHPCLLSAQVCAKLGLEGDENIGDDILEAQEESAANHIQHISDDILTNQSGKMIFLIKLLDQIKSEGHRCLIFSQSRKMLDIIEKVIKNRGHKIMRLDGAVTKATDREQRIRNFQSDDSYSVFLLTTQVGGVGITLTAADRVIIFDPNWNPATDAQAVDRAYRIGQEKNVIIYRLITCGTVEEKIYRRQIFKDSITRQTTGNSKNPYRYFSRYELRELFMLDDTHSSTTQRQLELMHSGQRKTDTELDTHIAFLYSLSIVGLSDHDLIFSQEIKPHEEFEEEEEDGSITTDYIQHRNAQDLIKMESELSSQILVKASQYPRNIDAQPSVNTKIESENTKTKRQNNWDMPKYIQAEPKLESDYEDLTTSLTRIKQEPGVKEEHEEIEHASFHSAKEEEEAEEEEDLTEEVEQKKVNLSIVEYPSRIEDDPEVKRESHLQDKDSRQPLKHEPHTPNEKMELKGHQAEHSTGSCLPTKKNIQMENATPRKQRIIEEEIITSADAAIPIVKMEPRFRGLGTSAQKNVSAELHSALMTAFANNSELKYPCSVSSSSGQIEQISFEESPNLYKQSAKNLYMSMVADSPLISRQIIHSEFSPIVQVADSVENSLVLQKDGKDTLIMDSDDVGENDKTDVSVSDEEGANGENGSNIDDSIVDSPVITSKTKRVIKRVIESSEEEDEGSFEMKNKTDVHSDIERLAKSELEGSAKEYYSSRQTDTRQVSRLDSSEEVTETNEKDDNCSLTEQDEEEEAAEEGSFVDENSREDNSDMEEEEVEDGFDNLSQEAKEMFNHRIDTGRMSETCCLCNKSYNSKRELKNHMIQAQHGRLVVICPWCYHEERKFKHVIDLKNHCRSHHFDQINEVPEKFFSENNAFWLSLYPQDYKRLIKSTSWNDPVAKRARVVVLEWTSRITRSTRSRSEWLQGWEAEGIQKSPQATPMLTNQDQQTNPLTNRFDSATPLSEFRFQPDYEDDDASMTSYSPTRPDMGKMIICEISLVPQNINAVVQQTLTKYRALLKDQVLYDPKAMVAIAIRIASLKPNLSSAPDGQFVPLSHQTLTSRKKEIADGLGVSPEYIISVSRAISADWKPGKGARFREIEEPSLPESALVLQPGLEPALPAALVPVPPSQMSSELSPVRNQCSKIPKTDGSKPQEKIFTNQARAVALLSQGCMPLFPPSRRDWSSVPEEDIKFAIGQTSFKWPPKGWEGMTPDKKLLIWEYTAMALSSAKTGLQFPSQERLDLLDTFNFLALPGTAKCHLTKKDQCMAKSRYYTCEVLRQVAKKGGDEPQMKHWLSILEQGTEHRDKDYDSLIKKTDGVNLRLDAD